jgi:hypothetical protein
MDRRGLLRVALSGAAGVLTGRSVHASLARAVRVEELVRRSQHVILGEPLDAYSVWEQVAERRHIVTYSRIRTHELLGGATPAQDELLVRTLGGRVGELGEVVHGEAQLVMGSRSVLFLMPTAGELGVTAMAQGHYPLTRDQAGEERLGPSPGMPELVDPNGSAVRRFSGLRVAEARSLVAQTVQK